MKRNLLLALVLVLAIALLLTTAAFAQEEEEPVLFRVDIRNQSDQTVSITLVGTDVFKAYVLAVGPGGSQVFTVQEGNYDHTTFACGESATGSLDVSQVLRLTFTPCFGDAVNSGEPTIEKIHLTDAPSGKLYRYQFD
jgi:hypothetical protein